MKIVLLAIAVLSVVVPDVVHVQGQTPPRTECSTLDDCAAGEYCSTVDGTCILNGDCTAVEDCTDNFDNIYASTMIIGTMYCIEDAGNPGKCHNIGMDTPALCSAYEYCADEDLEANCCPDEEGKFLACCAGIPNDDAASASEDAAASDPEDPLSPPAPDAADTPKECSAYEACAGLDGDCCPDKEGEFLTCCDGIPNDEEDDGRYVASCDSLNDCNTCLVASNNCVWQPVAGCLASCAVQDTSCYAIQYFGNETIEEICDIAATDNGSGGDGGMDGAIDPDFAVDSPIDPDFAVDSPIDPDFAVDPPIDPEFAVDSPVDPGFGVDPPIDPGFGVDPAQSCESDTDCESDKEYCGQGTCISKGMCIVDEDCMNTANDQYADKKCRGYKFCNEFKECDRMCGEPCPGGTGAEEAECTVTGCDTKILCPNSVSCTPDYCQDCKGMYFDPMGMVIDGCGVTITDDEDVSASSAAPTSADAPQDGSTSVSSPPTSATENDEEKEEKQNDKKDDEEKEEKQNDKKDDEEKEEKQNDKKNDEEKEEKGDAAAATTSIDETTVILIEPPGTTASADTTIADPSSTGEAIGEGTLYVSGSVSIVGLGRTIGSVAIVVLVTITAVLSL